MSLETSAAAPVNLATLPERFWRKVRKTSGCWEWQGGRSKGYGIVWWQGRTTSAHRLCWESVVGPIPNDCELDHVCRNRACVRPEHLRAVDHRTNVVVGTGRSALNAAKACCPKGHPYDLTRRRGDRSAGVQRRCRTCRNEQARQAYAEKARIARRAKWAARWGESCNTGCKSDDNGQNTREI